MGSSSQLAARDLHVYKHSKLGQADLVFGLWSEFIMSVHAGLQVNVQRLWFVPLSLTGTQTDSFRPAILLAQPAQTYNTLYFTVYVRSVRANHQRSKPERFHAVRSYDAGVVRSAQNRTGNKALYTNNYSQHLLAKLLFVPNLYLYFYCSSSNQ